MQLLLPERVGRLYQWRRYPRRLHIQSTRLYTPTSKHQAAKPFAKPKRSRHVFPRPAPHKSPQASLKKPLARQRKGSRWSRSTSRWHIWATKHKYIVFTFKAFVSGTVVLYFFASEPVPITGRRQLNFVPRSVAKWMAKSAREKEDGLREHLKHCSWHGDHPGMRKVNLIFDRLIRASGLGDRDWEVRVVLAPSK